MQSNHIKYEILESPEDGFFTLDREWRFNYVNRKAAILIEKKSEELIGKVIWEESPNIIGTDLEIAYRKAMVTRVIQRIEMKGLPGGNWYNIIVFPSGEGISVYWQDITKQKQAGKEQQIDNTERKRMEEALRESEEKYRKIVSTTNEGIGMVDARQKILFVNKTIAQWLGYEVEEMLDKQVLDFIFQEDWGKALAHKENRMAGNSDIYELRLRKKDGSFFWVIASSSSRSDKDGNYCGSLVMFTDITERKQMEEVLKENEERLRILVDSVAQAVWETDAEGVVVADSPSWRAYTGQTLEEWLGYGWVNAIHPDDSVYAERQWREAVAAERNVNAEFRLRSPNGDWRWTNVLASPLRDSGGKIIKWVSMNIDIDQRKQAEEALTKALRLAENRTSQLNAIINAMPTGVAIYDMNGKPVFMNENADKIFVYHSINKENDLMERTEKSNLHTLDGKVLALENTPIYRAINHGEINKNFIVVRRGPEAEFYTSLNCAPIRNSKGEITGAVVNLIDITEQKRVETELRESEEKYRTIFDSMVEAFAIIEMIYNSEGKPVDWLYLESNPAHEKYTRLHNAKGRLISRLAPKTEQFWFEIYDRVALTGETVRFEAIVRKRCYDLHIFKLGGQDSRKVAVFAYEITVRKRNEEKLTFQANLLSSVHDAVAAYDETGNLTYWNGMAEKMFGWPAQEVIGQSVEKLFPRDILKSRVEALAKLSEEGCFIGELEYHHKYKETIRLDAHVKMLVNQNGECKGAVGSFRDITRRKQQEEELKAVKESFAAEVEALTKLHALSMQFILKDNLKSIYGEILDAVIELTQADKGSLKIFDELNDCLEIIEQRNYEPHFLNNFKYIPIGKKISGNAFKDKKRITVEDITKSTTFHNEKDRQVILSVGIKAIQATPLISSSGNIVGILATLYTNSHQFDERELRMLDLLARQAADAIERTRAEEKIHQSEKRALALVDELRRMNENKNQFLSILSHELRNPLASIMMGVSLMDRVTPGGGQFRQAKDIIERQTTQLSRLVDDLLDVTRITQNKISLKKEVINLNELISGALEDYREQLAIKGVGLKAELNSVPLNLEADPARLIQVIGNLINNAAKFTAMGDTVLVKVWRDKEKQEAVICVRDNGIGIKPDLLPDLFLPFIQVDSTLDRSSGGLGLGLAIVKGMVELHGGSVSAASEGLGKGAQFTIRLPLPVLSGNNPGRQAQSVRKTSRILRILVIDDIPDVAEIICSLLRLMGHEVISAHNGNEGITKAREFRPEVLFCDIGMPGMNGYEVAESLCRDKDLKDTFMIALTGYAQPEDLERARAAGFNRHLAKPVDIAVLEQILTEV